MSVFLFLESRYNPPPLITDTPRITLVIEPKKTVLFICTGNFYRSRFSEYLFNAIAYKKGLRWRAISRGMKPWMVDDQGPVSEFAVERLATRHIQLKGDTRYPIPLSENDLICADLVIAMKESEHRAMMMKQFPSWADCINYWSIDDIDCKPPAEALPLCEVCVETLVEGLLAEQNRAARNRLKLAA
jgi:protein-tyrosine phosphatase